MVDAPSPWLRRIRHLLHKSAGHDPRRRRGCAEAVQKTLFGPDETDFAEDVEIEQEVEPVQAVQHEKLP